MNQLKLTTTTTLARAIQTKNPWSEFYRKRVNSSYQDYFNRRYKILVDLINAEKPGTVREEGVGIGSVSKALDLSVENLYGFDLCKEMLELCARNNPAMNLYQDDILRPEINDHKPDIIVTHGVLEHFSDFHIGKIFSRYKKAGVKNVHYVPTNGYDQPSFGDERLLPYQYWLLKFKPKDHLLFNDDRDLLLINI